MTNQIEKWNQSHTRIPTDKSVSQYAVEIEKEFPRDSFICDLGGGTGADAIYFLQQGHKVVLVDISDYALQVAVAKAKKVGLTLDTYRATLGQESIPLEDSSSDVVYSRLALHYFDRQTTISIFQDIYRVMKSGGRAYITLKSPEDVDEMSFLKKSATEKEASVFIDDGEMKSRFTTEQLQDILLDANIPSFEVKLYTENFSGRIDKVKSKNNQMVLNEILISKK
jgi:ubiquinone/menaquinone biosynthesis C-methylase UbiE